MLPELSFSVQQREGARAVVRVSGAMDYDTSDPLEEALTALVGDGAHHLVLDMAAVTFCDSSGINTLVRAQAHAKQEKGTLALVGAPARLQAVLEMTGVDTVITTYPTVALALDDIPG